MPKYKVTDSQTGRTFVLTGDSPPNENELNELFSSFEQPKEGPSLISKIGEGIKTGVEETGKFLGGAFQEPKETAIGLTSGVLKGLPKTDVSQELQSTPFGTFEQPSMQELELQQQIKQKQQAQPSTPPLATRTARRAETVGEFGTKAATGIAASTLVPGSGVLSTLGKGAVANIPFAAGQESVGGAAKDMAINTVVDLVTLGSGKLVGKPIKDAVGNIMQEVGKKIQMSTIKPRGKVIKEGFDINNVFKHGLEGDLETGLKKINTKFNTLTSELNNKIQASDSKINLSDMILNVMDKINKDPSKTFLTNIDSEKVINKVIAEIEHVSKDGIVNLVEAQNIKRATGAMGAWSFGIRDPEATAREKIYNLLYTELRQEIEKKAPTGVKEINKQLGELIPIERAIMQRIPVKQRQDLLSLTDVIGGATAVSIGPKGWGLFVLNKLSKSPLVGAKSFRTGESLKRLNVPFPAQKVATEALQERTSRDLTPEEMKAFGRLRF